MIRRTKPRQISGFGRFKPEVPAIFTFGLSIPVGVAGGPKGGEGPRCFSASSRTSSLRFTQVLGGGAGACAGTATGLCFASAELKLPVTPNLRPWAVAPVLFSEPSWAGGVV